jgi:Protein of unknown function (DUF2817)
VQNLEAFVPNYISARDRFRETLTSLGFHHEAYLINQLDPSGEELTIDVGLCSFPNASRSVVISSGLHGVEGFLGSAIQLALLKDSQFTKSLPSNTNLVFIHALNPYGFAWIRRCNEDNVDLNRNFLLPEEAYKGSPEEYSKLNSFLNPTSPPSQFEPFLLKAIWLILRYGMGSLMNTLPVGQYDYPKGLFFGGLAPSKTQQILAENLASWIGGASEVIHIDLHTGLGQWGAYKLLFDGVSTSESFQRLVQQFGVDKIEAFSSEVTAYQIRGGLGVWCQALMPQCRYDFLTAEFGTYSVIQVFKALRAENRAYWWAKQKKITSWTKPQLVEMFSPINHKWREKCITEGVVICKQACYSKGLCDENV